MRITSEVDCPKCGWKECVTEYTHFEHKYKTYCSSLTCDYKFLPIHGDDYLLLDEQCVNCKKGHRVISRERDTSWVVYCVLPLCRNELYVTEEWIEEQIKYHKEKKSQYQDWHYQIKILKDQLDE